MFDWTRCLKLFSFSLSPALVFCISCKRCTCATTCRQTAVNLLFFFTRPKKFNNSNIIKGNSWQKCRPHSKALTATQQTIQLLFHEVLGVFKKAGPASARRTTKGRPTPSLSSWHRYHLKGKVGVWVWSFYFFFSWSLVCCVLPLRENPPLSSPRLARRAAPVCRCEDI